MATPIFVMAPARTLSERGRSLAARAIRILRACVEARAHGGEGSSNAVGVRARVPRTPSSRLSVKARVVQVGNSNLRRMATSAEPTQTGNWLRHGSTRFVETDEVAPLKPISIPGSRVVDEFHEIIYIPNLL